MTRYAALLVILASVLAACQGGSTASPPASGEPSAGHQSSAPTASGSSSGPSPSQTSTPEGEFARDTIVEAVVSDLNLRDAPGLSGGILGSLPMGAPSVVIDGPVRADGFDWYEIHALGLSMGTGCEEPYLTEPFNCPGWVGWAAAAGSDGRPWLVEDDYPCPSWPQTKLTEVFVYGVPQFAGLACYGGEERTLTGFYPEIPPDGLGGACGEVPDEIYWLGCNLGYEQVVLGTTDGFFSSAFILAVPPAVTMPARGQWIEVTGSYDDPAAADCTFGTLPEVSVFRCRTQFVVSAVRAVDG